MKTQEAYIKIKETDDGKIIGVEANIPLIEQERNGGYIVRCPVLKTFGYSEVSFDEAQKDHEQDINAFFSVHIKRSSLKSALRSLGWLADHRQYEKPNIPAYLLHRARFQKKNYKAGAVC
jgi:hypothetical protein